MARSPLFDIYDPYGMLQDQARLGMLPGDDLFSPGDSRTPTLADLMPEEEKSSMLGALSQAGTSGLQAAGWLFDTPGAFVRGILAGKPLSFLGSSDERVSGRDLLRQYGMIGDEDTWGNFGGSLLAEAALDPLTYLNPLSILGRGSLTQAVGIPLKKAGLLRDAPLDAARGFGSAVRSTADDVTAIAGDTVPMLPGAAASERAGSGVREYLRNLTPAQAFAEARLRLTPDEYDEALRRFEAAGGRMDDTRGAAGLMSFRIPRTGIQYDISGGAFGDALAQGLDDIGEWSKRAPGIGPVSRTLASAFDADAGYTIDPDRQMVHRNARAAARRNEERFRQQMTRVQRPAMMAQVPESIDIDGVTLPVPEELRSFASPQFQNALADWLESGAVDAADNALIVPGAAPLRTSGDRIADYLLENIPEFRAARDTLDTLPGAAEAAARARALPLPTWTSRLADTRFFPRQLMWMDRDEYLPEQIVKGEKPYSRGDKLFSVTENFGRSRQLYTDIPGGRRTFRTLTGGPRARELQDTLLRANNEDAPQIIDDFFRSEGLETPYQRLIDQADSPEALAAAQRQASQMKVQLADLLRSADRQFADKGIGIFDTPVFADAMRYGMGQARTSAYADSLIDEMVRTAEEIPSELVRGGTSVPLRQAAQELNFDPDQFAQLFNQARGSDISNFSIDKRTLESMKVLAQPTRLGFPESKAGNLIDSFTRWFKAGALAWPSFHTRNAASNLVAGVAQETPIAPVAGYQAAKGNLDYVGRFLADAPVYRDLPDDAARAAKFAEDSARADVGSGNVFDELGQASQSMPGLYPGASHENDILQAARNVLNPEGRTWSDWLTLRGSGINRPAPRTKNPLLQLNDAVGATVEDTSRLGMFAHLLRQGYDPSQAGDMVRRALVDYRPGSFTPFEAGLKRLIPFYSFQKGIVPSIAENVLERPGGLMGQSIRAVSAGARPSEDNFVPERFRRSSAIPLPYEPAEGLRRYVTNLDAPWEAFFNLLTPGVGTNIPSILADTLMQTGSNLLGQTTPLVKAPIEFITNRQLYSGRNLSDAYSVLEADGVPGGRQLEQVISNFVPFGSRALSTYRQLSDERLNPLDAVMKAGFNAVSPVRFTDIDLEKTRRQAARDMLNRMLETTPGVRTYENITLPEDVLRTMPEEQRRMFLLYRIIQSEAAKRARDKKRQETAIDPLQVLGVLQ
jgi:hypothetical protein